MPRMTNNTRASLDFVTGIKDGEPVTESLAGGETRDIPVDLESAQVRGRILSGTISVSDAVAKKAAKPVKAETTGKAKPADPVTLPPNDPPAA